MMLGVTDLEKRKKFDHFIGPHRQEVIVLATLAFEAFVIHSNPVYFALSRKTVNKT